MTENKKNEGSGSRPSDSASRGPSSEQRAKLDAHVLEDMYPDAGSLFSAHPMPAISDASVVVALDTSALLLPYDMKKTTSLEELGKAYQSLTEANRLFIPARTAREFVNRRETSIGNLIHALNQQKGTFEALSVPVILKDMEGYKDATEA